MFLPFLVQLMSASSYETNYDELSIQQFFLFLRDELFIASDYKVNSGELIIDLPEGRQAYFVQMGSNVVRRVSGGFDVFLREVEHIQFTKWTGGVQVSVTSLQGDQYEKIFRVY